MTWPEDRAEQDKHTVFKPLWRLFIITTHVLSPPGQKQELESKINNY